MAISQTIAEIWRFPIFEDGGRRHVGFLFFLDFNCRNAEKG